MGSSSGSSSTVAERARAAWRMRLTSAGRTAAACAAVGVATLYGPRFLAGHIKFAAFSYLTAVVIVSDATLGDTLRGCWHALVASLQVVPPAMVWRWAIGPAAVMPVPAAAAAVFAAAFLVGLPGTHLTAKKIAFGQIVLVCSEVVLSEGSGGGYMHPLYVGASTALGALASVFALLLPYPGLASHKVQKLCRIYARNASQRMNVYQRALTATDKQTKIALVSRAKALSEAGAKLLQSIRTLEDGLWWERPWRRATRPGDRLQSMELEMRGIEYSLLSSSALPLQAVEQEQLSNLLQSLSTRIEEKIEQVVCYSPLQSRVESDTREFMGKAPSSPLPSLKQGWLFLYFSCIDMFLNDTVSNFTSSRKVNTESNNIATRFKRWIQKLTSYDRLHFAFKCSFCLGLAMLLGLTFDKENGCWAGLTIAISFVEGRQAIFTIANYRVQGTALGSVYGVICCFLFHFEEFRLIALLPWVVFTSFLRHSRMYGQTGGVSAAIGALVILGRKNYGPPNEFAIARLTEVFIGLSAFIVVELFLQPTRAATLAKNQTFQTLRALQDCIKETRIHKKQTAEEFLDLKEKQRDLSHLVSQLKEYVSDAEMEPGFWYLPFNAPCYKKLVQSMSNIVDMLRFISHNLELLSKLAETNFGSKFQEHINNEVQLLQETLSSAHIYQEAIIIEFQAVIEEEMEAGNLQKREKSGVLIVDHAEIERETDDDEEEGGDVKNQRERMIQCLRTMRFCISSVMRELENITFCMREMGSMEN